MKQPGPKGLNDLRAIFRLAPPAPRRWGAGGMLLLAFLITFPAAAQAQSGKEALQAIIMGEARGEAGELKIRVEDRRAKFEDKEKPENRRKRLLDEKPQRGEGSFRYGPPGWLKDLNILDPDGKTVNTRSRIAQTGTVLRFLIEGVGKENPERYGRVIRVGITTPADAILGHSIAKATEGIQWGASRTEGEDLVLEGTRGTEKHTLTLGRTPQPWIKSWAVVRSVPDEDGKALEQNYSCEVVPGDKPGTIGRMEEWVINSPPLANISYRITEVVKTEPLPSLKPESLKITFPKGTLVVDARGEVPLEYEQTEAGVNEDEVAAAASDLAKGRTKVGQTAPSFSFKAPGGQTTKLEEYRGKVVVLFWFSTESRLSDVAAPAIREIQDRYRKKGVQVLGLNVVDDGDVTRKIENYRKKYRWEFPVWVDTEGEAMYRYGTVAGVPKVAIITREGVLAFVQPGFDAEAVQEALDRLTEEKKK